MWLLAGELKSELEAGPGATHVTSQHLGDGGKGSGVLGHPWLYETLSQKSAEVMMEE